MNKTMTAMAALAMTTGAVQAGGLDRSNQSVLAVFGAHKATSFSFGVVQPNIKGTDAQGNSYNVGRPYALGGVSFSRDVNDRLNYAVIIDHPFGVDINYGTPPTTSALGGTSADLNSVALSFVMRYKLTDRISVFGGAKVQRIDATVALHGQSYAQAISVASAARAFNAGLPAGVPTLGAAQLGDALGAAQAGNFAPAIAIDSVYGPGTTRDLGDGVQRLISGPLTSVPMDFFTGGGYNFNMEDSTRLGYVIGGAYEIPDIALRLAATYHFETTHKADTVETLYGSTTNGSVDYVSPQSFNLDFQTGIAPGTLLTASYRWTEFSAVDIVPTLLQSDLVNLEDSHRYTLGVARRFSEKFAGSLTLSYEPEDNRATVSPLGPTDGLKGISLGGQYTDGPLKVSGGINYSWLGDADAGIAGRPVAQFRDSSATAVGLKVEMSF